MTLNPAHIAQRIMRRIGNRDGAISVELALIAPVMMVLAFGTYDLATVTQSRDRGNSVFYAMTDAITSRDQNLTCHYLDQLGDLAYKAFLAGNNGALEPEGTEFRDSGNLDFRYQVRGLKIPDTPQNLLPASQRDRAYVMWAFHRTYNNLDRERDRRPGQWIPIEPEYIVPGEFYIEVEGRHFQRPPLNLFSFTSGRESIQVYNSYLAPRYVAEIDLIGPEVSNRCENDDPGID